MTIFIPCDKIIGIMKKKLKYLLCVILCTIFLITICLGGAFQNIKWGDSPKDVKASMKNKKWKGNEKHYIYYNETLFEMKFMNIFLFDNDKLYRIELAPSPSLGKVDIFVVFLKLRGEIRKQNGEPLESLCSNRADIVDNREALIRGKAECHEIWHSEDTRIALQLERRRNALTGELEFWKPMVLYTPLMIDPDAKVD